MNMTIHQAFSFSRPVAPQGGAARTVTKSADARFTPLEWNVIALAERDSLASIRVTGRLAAAMGSIFGGHASARLADEHLETLRRVAVMISHERALADEDVTDFMEAGFTSEQFELLCGSLRRRDMEREGSSSSAGVTRRCSRPATANSPMPDLAH